MLIIMADNWSSENTFSFVINSIANVAAEFSKRYSKTRRGVQVSQTDPTFTIIGFYQLH